VLHRISVGAFRTATRVGSRWLIAAAEVEHFAGAAGAGRARTAEIAG